MSNIDFTIPEGLSDKGRKAAETLIELAKSLMGEDASGGGCRAFYTPEEWADRGERYGLKAELIVVHDGGDLAPLLNLDYGAYNLFDKQCQALQAHGVYAEGCTGWYTAIYE